MRFASRSIRKFTATCLLGWFGTDVCAAGTLLNCNGAAISRVVQPSAMKAGEARAYWLSRQWLQWPGAGAGGRFRLYFSSSATLHTQNGRLAGADGWLSVEPSDQTMPASVAGRFKFIGRGPRLRIPDNSLPRLPVLLQDQMLLVHEDLAGHVLDATGVQLPGALDDWFSAAATDDSLGVTYIGNQRQFKLWAPTARAVSLCLYRDGKASEASASVPLRRDLHTGIWSTGQVGAPGSAYYLYLVDVMVPGLGLVRNRVTDPYSTSLGADAQRSYSADLASAQLKPAGWDATPLPKALASQTDMVIYELHVRDFSSNDASVPAHHRGRYLAFTDLDSQGMQHLRGLTNSGLTDVHLLPVFDFSSVPEQGCSTPTVPAAPPDDDRQQAATTAAAANDCFNWGYDPVHFSAPEGSYATDAADGAVRVREFRQMVQALHRIGLRVGMDVVYNHTSAAGQDRASVLDRIVPGYYQRLDALGQVEHSTCCANTATENLMMGKLMLDSVLTWATRYRIDSFRFDLMAHQPRALMESLQARLDHTVGRHVNLIGEGWNFGEVANGERFVQASQLSLGNSGIGTFSDRGRDALRGGSAGDSGMDLLARQGYVNGLFYDPNAVATATRADLLRTADLVRVGLAGSLRSFHMQTFDGRDHTLEQVAYGDQPAGYAAEPGEVVNYVENHDNQTLFDINALRLPRATSSDERARVQLLAAAVIAFSQGVAYFHAGVDTLRSKSLDRNSFDSGDWFNRIDWSYQDNYFGSGLPPRQDNGKDYALLQPVLADTRIKPRPATIAFMRNGFRDLLRIRASTRLFRLADSEQVRARLKFFNAGPTQNPVVIAAHLDGADLADARFREVIYLVNVDPHTQTLTWADAAGKHYVLHPVQQSTDAADKRPARQAAFDSSNGRFTVPGRTALVYVVLP